MRLEQRRARGYRPGAGPDHAWRGPFDCSSPEELKSSVQRRVEADLRGLLDAVVAKTSRSSGPVTASGRSAATRER